MSLIRDNLMERPGYTPYCGDMKCSAGMPRTTFDGSQFNCLCGWRSGFDAEFIQNYKAKWAKPDERLYGEHTNALGGMCL